MIGKFFLAVALIGLTAQGAAQAQAGSWGAISWDMANERADPRLDHIHYDTRRCEHVAGMAWNYGTKREAMEAASDVCRKEWGKAGTRVRIHDTTCGDLGFENPAEAGYLVVTFGPGQCAAYATGQHKIAVLQRDLGNWKGLCPVSATGVGASKSEAECIALADCGRWSFNCRITLSACNDLR